MTVQESRNSENSRRLVVIALLGATGIALAYVLSGTLLLIFASILLAVVLDVATRALGHVMPVPRLLRLSIVATVGCTLLIAAAAWGGVRLVTQANDLVEMGQQQIESMMQWAEKMGLPVVDSDDEAYEGSFLQNFLPDSEKLFGHAQTTFAAVTGILGNIVILFFLGIFFAADPAGYRDGFIKLLPVRKRARVSAVLVETGHTLQWWMIGQLITMALVAVSVALMLFLVGIPNAILLGLIAGLLNFIPFLGPLLAAIPVFLAAMPEGVAMVTLVMTLFVIIESLEGYLLNPLIQKRAVYLPPAWSLAALVAFGVLFGGLGVALATPILAVSRVMVLRLYVEDVLEAPVGPLHLPPSSEAR